MKCGFGPELKVKIEGYYVQQKNCCGSNFEASESNFNCTAKGVHNTKPIEYEEGCYDKIVDWLPYLGIGFVVIICIQVLILIISCCLQRKIKEDQYIEFF